MAYNEFLADKLRQSLKEKKVAYAEKNMMGGLTFMVENKMCVGIVKDDMMARIDPEVYEKNLKRTGAKPMDFTGRLMKGYVFIEPVGWDDDTKLDYWVNLALEFNPKAKASKSRKKKK